MVTVLPNCCRPHSGFAALKLKRVTWRESVIGCQNVQYQVWPRAAEREKEREMFYLTTHSTHFIYGYMASDIWLRTIVRKETRCRHIGLSYRLTARVLLYAPSHRQDNTYHGLCYTSREALAGTRNSSMGPPHEGSIRRPTAPWATSPPNHAAIYSSVTTTHEATLFWMVHWRMFCHSFCNAMNSSCSVCGGGFLWRTQRWMWF